MRALRLDRPGPIETRPLSAVTMDAPDPGPGEVRVAVSVCAVCRTDLQLCEGDLAARRLPIVPGHQIVGIVEATGGGTDGGLNVGDRVGIAWIAGACGTCRFCRSGRENLCETTTFTGWDRDGGYAELVTAAAEYCYRLPTGFDDLAAAPLLCGGVIGYRSLGVAGVHAARPPGRLGLFGFGASATVVIQVACHWGWEVFVSTRSAREQQRARRLGAVWAGSYEERVPAPLDAAITFAPSGDVVIAALRAVDRGGTVAVNAIHLDRVPEFSYDLLWWERSIRSVANVTRTDVRELLSLAAEVPLHTDTEMFALEQANEALLALREGRISGAAVLGG